MALSKEQIKKIADLSRIGLTEEELTRFAGQLSGILATVELLNEVDTENVEPTYQSTGLQNVVDSDVVKVDEQCTPEELLSCTELNVEARQILVKNVF